MTGTCKLVDKGTPSRLHTVSGSPCRNMIRLLVTQELQLLKGFKVISRAVIGYTNLPNAFFAILLISSVLRFIYCRCNLQFKI
jgi:hypothetical protein